MRLVLMMKNNGGNIRLNTASTMKKCLTLWRKRCRRCGKTCRKKRKNWNICAKLICAVPIRQAEKEMFHTIAVICGAWHVPALKNKSSQKEDNDLLKGLPKTKTECTWIPWTFNRLSFYSGYGAGINSPGWYNHVWQNPR